MTRRPEQTLAVVLATVLLLLGACSSGPQDGARVRSTTEDGPPVTYASLGGTEALGGRSRQPLADTWPQLLYRTSFPIRTVFVNLARPQSTVANALNDQLADALGLQPTVATVWFGTADAFAATSIEDFARDLTDLTRQLTDRDVRVLVVLGPPPADGDVDTAPYTDAASSVARVTGAEVVDIRDLTVTPSSQQAVADAIVEVLGPIE